MAFVDVSKNKSSIKTHRKGHTHQNERVKKKKKEKNIYMYIGLIDEKYEGTRSVEIDVDTLRDLTYSDMTKHIQSKLGAPWNAQKREVIKPWTFPSLSTERVHFEF